MKTYTRIEAATEFNVSNVMIGRNLKAIEAMGFTGLVTDDNRLTERAIYLIGLYRDKDFSMLDDELEADRETSTDCDELEATSTTCDAIDCDLEEPQSITAGIVRRTEAIQNNALAIARRTDELASFEIPVVTVEDVTIDIDELRAICGLGSSLALEADAYRSQASQHEAEIAKLKEIQDQLDVAQIIADEKAKIQREQAIRAQVRKSLEADRVKQKAAVA